MFKLRKLRADKHFAIVDFSGPFPILPGYIIEYMGVFYECKFVIIHTQDHITYNNKAPVMIDEQIQETLPELIVESFPLI